ncbi:MAG TPA: DUF1206 domain-containing protein [Frankiaceae bacterium]|nr:DUF1206 domain-containing protein [Frankiaceae bacterium]
MDTTAVAALHGLAVRLGKGTTGAWLRAVSRLGLVSRGMVYVLVGLLALRLAAVASGDDDEAASTAGAVHEIAVQPWGRAMLAVLSVGLAAYAVTQLVEAVFRPLHADGKLGRWQQRVVSSWGCLLYLVFCVSTVSQVLATRPDALTATSEHRDEIARATDLLRTVPGRLLLIVIGLVAAGVGVELVRRSLRLNFRERFFSKQMQPRLALLTNALGTTGCLARAAVFGIAGVFLVKAGVQSDAQQTKGPDAIFRYIASATLGPYLLGALAVGLLCYGLYCLLEARHRDLTPGR